MKITTSRGKASYPEKRSIVGRVDSIGRCRNELLAKPEQNPDYRTCLRLPELVLSTMLAVFRRNTDNFSCPGRYRSGNEHIYLRGSDRKTCRSTALICWLHRIWDRLIYVPYQYTFPVRLSARQIITRFLSGLCWLLPFFNPLINNNENQPGFV